MTFPSPVNLRYQRPIGQQVLESSVHEMEHLFNLFRNAADAEDQTPQ